MASVFDCTNDLREFLIENAIATGRKLGKGAFGEVMELLVDNTTLCAGKQLHAVLIDPQNVGSQASVTRFSSECSLMSQVDHSNVVQFMGVCFIEPNVHPLLVMEKLDTSLDEILERHTNIPLPLTLSILLDISSGLVYLHEFTPPIVHRDLTARNVLLKYPTLLAKIADLGNAMIVDPSNLRMLSKAPGTTLYMPPEAFQEVPKYDTQLDVFSFGHLALFALNEEYPAVTSITYNHPVTRKLHARTEVERRQKHIDKLVKKQTVDHTIAQMTIQCLHNLPEERPTSWELKETLEREQMPLDDDILQHVRKLIGGDNTENPSCENIYAELSPHLLEKSQDIYENLDIPTPTQPTPVKSRLDTKSGLLEIFRSGKASKKKQPWKVCTFQIKDSYLRCYKRSKMDKAIDEVNLKTVMHVRAHPVGYRDDISFFCFEVHFSSSGKGLYPSPWELRTFSLVERTSWINAIEANAPNCSVRGLPPTMSLPPVPLQPSYQESANKENADPGCAMPEIYMATGHEHEDETTSDVECYTIIPPSYSPPPILSSPPPLYIQHSTVTPPPHNTSPQQYCDSFMSISGPPPILTQASNSSHPLPHCQVPLPPIPHPQLISHPPIVTTTPSVAASPKATKDDTDSSDADDTYVAIPTDLESLDISKLTLEQFEQIDSKRAQLWMFLKMHQMVRKVEGVYQSAEHLYSIYAILPQALTRIKERHKSEKSDENNLSENEDNQPKQVEYENTEFHRKVKPPVPLPRKCIPKSEVGQLSGPTRVESEAPESIQLQDSAQTVVKHYRKQEVIDTLIARINELNLEIEKHLVTGDDMDLYVRGNQSRPMWTKASAINDKSIMESLQQEMAEMSILYIDEEAIEVLNDIGEGQFGMVCRGIYRRSQNGNGSEVAIKTIKANQATDDFLKEMRVMSRLIHPNIVRFHGLVHRQEDPWMILEYFADGSLKQFLENKQQPVEKLIKYMLDIAMGMTHISGLGLIHRDLAARNIMVGCAGQEENCKVGDFGLLRELPQGEAVYVSSRDVPLPIRWMAPESLEDRKFSIASDVWSFGVVLWEMYNPKEIPYDKIKDATGLAMKIGRGLRLAIPEEYPSKVKRIMKACWQEDPTMRPSFILIAQLLTSYAFTSRAAT